MILRSPRDLGAAVRARRRELGLDQATLAARVGVSRQWVIALEKGKAGAELALVLRTFRSLGLMIDVRAEPDADPTDAAVIDDVLARARTRS